MRNTRRAVLALSAPAALAIAACGAQGAQPGGETKSATPKEMSYVKPVGSEQFDAGWRKAFAAASAATNVKATLLTEPGGAPFWEKRQNEFAAGVPGADATYNQNNWVLIGGLKGMFADFLPYMTRDKINQAQYLKIELESWRWKGKQWGIPFQSGGEAVMLNKQIFQERGVPLPSASWTYDDLIQISQRLNDPANNRAGVVVGQNGIQYMAGTFMRNYGGKVLNDARNKALYADDAASINGTITNVDLHQKYKVTPIPAMTALVPAGSSLFRSRRVAINIDYIGVVPALADLGAGNVEVLPPPKGPTGAQSARVVGNAWSILTQSKNQDAAWLVFKYLHSKDGQTGEGKDHLLAAGWPAIISTGEAPWWADQFKGTRIADVIKVWSTTGHNQVVLPEGDLALQEMNPPLARAINGEIGVREALRESQDKVNVLFGKRPKEWEQTS
ncbi:MAG TPA: extracellular solute-binding protein [Chloroflexota bacterium]|nr:extracellular solute-binding protein [Chloroflexota bacterium]